MQPLEIFTTMTLRPDDGTIKYLWNFGKYLPEYKAICEINYARTHYGLVASVQSSLLENHRTDEEICEVEIIE